MRVKLEFNMDSHAFEDEDLDVALAFMFRQARRKIIEQLARPAALCTAPESADKLLDVNGNTIGSIQVDQPLKERL